MRAITKGDLVVVRSSLGSGMVMVTNVMPRLFVGVLIHTFPEMATDADVVFRPGEVAPYPVVVQCDLYGTFYRSQAAKVVGHVPVDDLSFGLDPYLAAKAVSQHLDKWRGLPIWRGDARWQWKQEQLDELRPLTQPFWSRFQW